MKKNITFWVTLFFILNLTWASLPLDIINKDLNKNVIWALTNHPDKKNIIEKFGKPQLEEKEKFFYALDDYKYSLSMKFSNDKLTYLSYKVPNETKISLKDFRESIKSEDLSLYPNMGHEKGRYLSVLLKEEKLQLIFINNSEKKLFKVIYEQK